MRRSTIITALLVACTFSLTAGCEDEVNPFIGTDFPFTVWGFINPKADTHAVRIFEIESQLALIEPTPLDAVVTTIHLESNQRQTWRDSIIALGNGDYRHVFWANFAVEHEDTYRIEVERSDGVVTRSADIKVPPPVTLEIIPPDVNDPDDVILPMRVAGGAPALPRLDVTYRAFSTNNDGEVTANNPVTISYSNQATERPDGWILNIDVAADFQTIETDFILKDLPRTFICTRDLTLTVHVGNAEWVSPVGLFDANALVEPGTLSNIENGFGFFGAGYTESVSWDPPQLMLIRAGFVNCPTEDPEG